MNPPTTDSESSALDPASLGFAGDEARGWVKTTCGVTLHYRCPRSMDELAGAEELQETVFGMSERDLVSASELIAVQETGGEVIAAYRPDVNAGPGMIAGVLIGWGGFYEHTPRIVSDFMAVRAEQRNLGIGADLKRLQAALAIKRGFREIVWTVDPLRAANARLNFNKLGAVAIQYEENRYGSDLAPALYGGLPTDRLHVTWRIKNPAVQARIRGEASPDYPDWVADVPVEEPVGRDDKLLIPVPADIDTLLAAHPDEARRWRFAMRHWLNQAFAEGWQIVAFRPGQESNRNSPAYLLERVATPTPGP